MLGCVHFYKAGINSSVDPEGQLGGRARLPIIGVPLVNSAIQQVMDKLWAEHCSLPTMWQAADRYTRPDTHSRHRPGKLRPTPSMDTQAEEKLRQVSSLSGWPELRFRPGPPPPQQKIVGQGRIRPPLLWRRNPRVHPTRRRGPVRCCAHVGPRLCHEPAAARHHG
jgi:hypothetical protein